MTFRKVFPHAVTIGIIAIALAIGALALFGCKSQPKRGPAPTPATPMGQREAAFDARDSLLVALIDAWSARVVDLRSPEQVAAMLKAMRTGFRVVPSAADVKLATATVEAVAKGNLKPADDTAKVAEERATAIAAAVQAEKDARVTAEKSLDEERKRHKQEVDDLKASWSKNLQLWTARGFIGAGAIVVAFSISAIFWAGIAARKHIICGILSGMASMAVGFAVGETWFLIAGRIVAGLLLASLVGWLVYLAWTAIIERRTRLAIQDAKDEVGAGGEQAAQGWAWLKEHLSYRMPRKPDGAKSAVEKAIDARLVAEGVKAAS